MKAKRILSCLLSVVMLLGVCSGLSFAAPAETGTTPAPDYGTMTEEYPDASVTVPADTELYVGLKEGAHFVRFTEMLPSAKVEDQETTTYYFALEDNKTYNYRVTSENHITYAGKFKKTADFSLHITEDMLETDGKTKTTIDRDTASNNGYNVADIYLNINPQGYLKLNENDTYQIVNLRNWEAVDSVTANYFLEPDYHYTVIDENGTVCNDVIEIDENGIITAVGKGTAIVLVTYDAIRIDFGSGADFYGAIWPENTGVFVVSVDAGDSGIVTGMTINEGKNSDTIKLSGDSIDAEHDCIYYAGESGAYTFTPGTDGAEVSVANPTVDQALYYTGFTAIEENTDGSVTVPLKHGRNIVKLTKDGKSEYQIITAKKVTVTINNGEEVHPGDTLRITFDTLYHPANKLAGVYNMTAIPVYQKVSGYENKLVGGLSAQYNFASSEHAQSITNILKEKNVWGVISYEKDTDFIVPADYAYDTFTLAGGSLYASGWGDSYGNHRGITLTDGKAPNFNAAAKLAWLGSLPDIEVPIVATTAELSTISLDATGVKKDYYEGDSFDTSGLIVTANYADGKTQIVTNYTVFPEVLTADTEKVRIDYRGKTAEIDVNVTAARVTGIEVTTPPAKTSYQEGDAFDPTGMVVTATYGDGTKKAVTDYTYAPNRVLSTDDKEIVITYTGEDKIPELTPATVSISVSALSGGGGSGTGSNSITVYVTVYGDDKHGALADSSGAHTMSANNLKLWVSKTAVTVGKGSYVIDAVTKVLSIAGIPYTNADGNYISAVKGLEEFDNGSLSGWMYTLNGKYPSLGVAEQKLSKGDAIVFHYTDDYTKEESSSDSSSSGSLSGGSTGGFVGFPSNGLFTGASTGNKAENTEPDPEEKPQSTESTFPDSMVGDWYYEAVNYVTEKGLMKGTETGFEPDSSMTRAMLVTVLYRLENPAEEAGEPSFTDVPAGAWYSDAIAWAAENEIVKGISDTHFAPDAYVTREQMAVILYRYAKFKGYNTAMTAKLSQLADCAGVSDWALEALQWAYAAELLKGTSETTISPQDTATRAQVATILMRFCENIANH